MNQPIDTGTTKLKISLKNGFTKQAEKKNFNQIKKQALSLIKV